MTFKAPPTQSLCLKAESLTGQDRPPNAPVPTAPFSGGWGQVGEVGVMEPAQSPLRRDIPSSEATVIPRDWDHLAVALWTSSGQVISQEISSQAGM